MGATKYILLFLFLLFIIPISHAQLGEQAGQPFLNVSLGGSGTFNYSILNSGSAPIGYQVILPTLNTIPNNATPTVSVFPMNGTLAPNSHQTIEILVSMPSGDKPYLKWNGVLQVVEASASQSNQSGMGAVIRAGVAKIVTIESAPPKSIPVIYYVIAAVIVIIIIITIIYLFVKRRKAKAAVAEKAKKQAEEMQAAKAKLTAAKGKRTAKKSTNVVRRKTIPAAKGVKRKTAVQTKKKSQTTASSSTRSTKRAAKRA
jgi:uncharacterized protein (UPF0333 family)